MSADKIDTKTQREEIDELREELSQLKGLLKQSTEEALNPRQEVQTIPSEQEVVLRADDYINIMSLVPYHLNLATAPFGQGVVKRFIKFGETKRILYSELTSILENHRNFIEEGLFYILDSRVVRQHGLDDIYSRILTKERIEEILEAGEDVSVELFAQTSRKQQEIIVQMLIEKIARGEYVNLNVIDKISRIYQTNIVEAAEERKAFFEQQKSAE